MNLSVSIDDVSDHLNSVVEMAKKKGRKVIPWNTRAEVLRSLGIGEAVAVGDSIVSGDKKLADYPYAVEDMMLIFLEKDGDYAKKHQNIEEISKNLRRLGR